MTPDAARSLQVGDWLTFTPNIWAQPIPGEIVSFRVVDLHVEGFRIEWLDGHISIMRPEDLHSSKFQPLETDP